MTEDEYIRYLVYIWKRNYPNLKVPYPIDDGCNCLFRTGFELKFVQKTTFRCHCTFVYRLSFKRAGMQWITTK